MKRIIIYVDRKGELAKLLLWGECRFKSIITGVCATKLDTAALDLQESGEVVIISDDLLSGERLDFSNRRPIKGSRFE